ncbi:MAG: amidohydrolase family protein [Candidatus Rokubacteria bacterium]|nr:amidohydrolase family protein [Candidatus Rokubacteria bacterium]
MSAPAALTLAGGRLVVEHEDGTHTASEPVDVRIRDGRIEAIVPHAPVNLTGPDTLDVRGMLVVAGLVNGHTHSHETFHKGRYENLPLEVWMHYVRPPFPTPPLDAEAVYLRTMVTAIEALRGGATTVVDDVNQFPHLRDDHIEAVFRAYEDLGLRALVSVSLFDRPFFRAVPYIEEELPAALLAELSAAPAPDPKRLVELAADLIKRRHPHRHRVGFIVAPSAPQRCTDQFLVDLLGLARQERMPTIIHVHETRLQAVTGQRFYRKTMIAHLDDLGVLGPLLSLIHGVWLRPDDISRLASAGATVQHNPVSNLRLASGLAPVRALIDGGVNVSLGSDGCGSCTSSGMLHVVGAAAMLHTLRGEMRGWVGAREAWAMGTVNGARALGFEDLGRVVPGQRADLVCYRLDGVGFTPLNDPLRQLVCGERGQSIDTVVIDGRVVMRGGRITTVDEAGLLAAAREVHGKLVPDIARCDGLVDQIRPVYERIYRRCLSQPIPADTYPARF